MNNRNFSVAALLTALLLATVSNTVRADDAGNTAEVTRTTNFSLLVQEFKNVSFSNFKYLDSDKYGQKAGSLIYSDIEFDALVVPNGCNTSYYRGEILARIQGNDVYDNLNPVTKVDFGTLNTIGVGSTCPGLPPRPVHLKLTLVNGIGALFGQYRIFTFQFDGPRNRLTQNPEQWFVRVAVNQATGKLEVLPTERKSDEPVIPDTYTQKISCDTSGRFHKDGVYPDDNRLELVVTKTAGDAHDSRNYAISVTGTSKSFFGPDSSVQQFKLMGNTAQPKYMGRGSLSFVDTQVAPNFEIQLETRWLGWKAGGGMSITLASGEKNHFASCMVTDLAAGL